MESSVLISDVSVHDEPFHNSALATTGGSVEPPEQIAFELSPDKNGPFLAVFISVVSVQLVPSKLSTAGETPGSNQPPTQKPSV